MPVRVEVTMYNQGEIAELLGVERETVSRWKNDTADPLPCHRDSGGDGSGDHYFPAAVIQWHLRHELKRHLNIRRR